VSQQINLYDAALRRRREVLTAPNLAAVAAVLAVGILAWGGWERSRLAPLEQETQQLAAQTKMLQEELAVVGARRAGLKADAAVAAELAAGKELLSLRREAMEELKKRMDPATPNYADYLRALARQTPTGLWLTGFAVGSGPAGLEIRGRMTEPMLLAEFIRRLNSERVFQGQSFAALQVNAAKPAAPPAPPAGQNQPPAVVATLPVYHEFSLVPAKDTP
jgi:hypothetical protein